MSSRDASRGVTVIGLLDNGTDSLTPLARSQLRQADLVIGAGRLLELGTPMLRNGVETRDLTGRLSQVPAWIEAATASGQSVVVLASGDPLCHGIAGYLRRKLAAERLEILPNLSTLQLACARLGLSWQDAHICSVHSRDAGEWNAETRGRAHGLYPLFRACMDRDKIIVFTSPENDPARIARLLLHESWSEKFSMSVAEHLLRDDEQLITGVPVEALAQRAFADPNVVVLERKASRPSPVRFGREDGSFVQRKPEKGLITKCEVRALSLGLMQLRAESIVWDIGAGSGAVGLEAARLCPDGWVYAIEKNPADVAIAEQNRSIMDVHHYTLVHGKAPQTLEQWPDPDAVFVGGSGGELAALIRLALRRLRPDGRLVMNFVTIENLGEAVATLKKLGARWQVTQMQVSRSRAILDMHRMAAENPVWIVSASGRKETQ